MDGTLALKKYNVIERLEALEEGGGELPANVIVEDDVAYQFSTTTSYLAGSFVYKDNQLYRFDVDHAAGDWNSEEVTAVRISDSIISEFGDGLQRTGNEVYVKLGAGLTFDANGAITPSSAGEISVNQISVTFDSTGRGVTNIPIATCDVISAFATNLQAIVIPFWGNDGYFHLKSLESADMSAYGNTTYTVRVLYRTKPSSQSKKKK